MQQQNNKTRKRQTRNQVNKKTRKQESKKIRKLQDNETTKQQKNKRQNKHNQPSLGDHFNSLHIKSRNALQMIRGSGPILGDRLVSSPSWMEHLQQTVLSQIYF